MPFTSIAEVIATENPSKAELALIEACRAGRSLTLPIGATEATLPPEGHAKPDREIRAELLRLLIIGGTTACHLHAFGIVVIGAHITGTLDLRSTSASGQCILNFCRFYAKPRFEHSHFAELNLDDCHLPGLYAQRISVNSSVFLRRITATDMVDVGGAKIGGQLAIDGSRLYGSKEAFTHRKTALYAQAVQVGSQLDLSYLTANYIVDLSSAKVGGQVVCVEARLNGGLDSKGNQQDALIAEGAEVRSSLVLQKMRSLGTVALAGAKIGGQLDCEGAKLDGGKDKRGNQHSALDAQGVIVGSGTFLRFLTAKGMVDLNAAQLGGQLDCEGADLDGGIDNNGAKLPALNSARMRVAQGFLFRRLKSVLGQVNLGSAHVGDLEDDEVSWPKGQDQLYLNGFTYDRIADGPLTLAGRKDWLARGSRLNGTFLPQPYTHFARVLRDMGHASEARKVLMERDRLLFAESHQANLTALNAARTGNGSDVGKSCLRYHLLRFWDWFSFVASGYGHAPQRALFVSFLAIGIGAILFFTAWHAGVMVPNSAIILTSPDWFAAMKTTTNAPSHAWIKLPSATHYETFYSLPYALDVFVPFVSLGQEQAWAATTTSGFGIFVRWFTFAYQITGWAITALGIAAITGFVQKNQPD